MLLHSTPSVNHTDSDSAFLSLKCQNVTPNQPMPPVALQHTQAHHSYHEVSSLLLQHQQHHDSTSNRPKGTAVCQEQPTLVSTLQAQQGRAAAVPAAAAAHLSAWGAVTMDHLQKWSSTIKTQQARPSNPKLKP